VANRHKKAGPRPGFSVVGVTPEDSAIEDAVQVFGERNNVRPFNLVVRYKNFLFHITPPENTVPLHQPDDLMLSLLP
jgi:hypothetical protein